jgi:thioredoxin reductase
MALFIARIEASGDPSCVNRYDIIVIGGSAAGLSAALVLSRARRSVAVVDNDRPRNAPATHMHGFLGSDGLPPAELLAAGRAEVAGYGADLIRGTVTKVEPSATTAQAARFDVHLEDASTLHTRSVLVATGLRDELPAIDGLAERWARDVLHCPYCHGWEVRDRPIGVIGGTGETVRYAQIVRQWSHDIVYFTPTDTPADTEQSELVARAIGIVEGDIARVVVEDDRLRGVEMTDGRAVSREVLFLPPRFVPNSTLLADLGCDVDADGWPGHDATGATSVPGIWVAGNVGNPRAQVITAAGEGSAAAIAINAALVADDVRNATRDYAPDLA